MNKRSRRYREAEGKITAEKKYPLREAVTMVKEFQSTRFDETVELSFLLGIDPKKTEQMVRGTVTLPHGTGKETRIAVFVRGADAEEAQAAGADFVGYEDLISRVQEGWTDFDAAITTPDSMRDIGRLGKILGPRGLMPSPKAGTVTRDIAKAVKELKAGKIEFRNDKGGSVHIPIGKRSFSVDALVENAERVIDALLKTKPAAAKGIFLVKCVISLTMSPGVRVEI